MAIRTFPDVGDGALPQSQKLPSGTGGDVARSPIIAVTGLKMEAKLKSGQADQDGKLDAQLKYLASTWRHGRERQR
jgi:hypothetical protein